MRYFISRIDHAHYLVISHYTGSISVPQHLPPQPVSPISFRGVS